MPKTDIDYSSTIIYKITCRDPLIKDLYVGHTTNFVQRKHAHKQSCMNEKSLNYKLKLYETIRNNGNWENWKMEIIDFFECKNLYEARKKEQEYFTSLNANLNSIEPYAKKPKEIKQKFNCTICSMVFTNENTLEIHNKTKKHLKNKENTGQKQPQFKYNCDICNYNTIRKSQYERHIGTSKHQALVKNNVVKDEFKCTNCNKVYMDRSGLWKHKKKCKLVEENQIESENDNATLKSLILDVIKNNNELQKENQNFQLQILEICKHIKSIQEISD